MVDQLFPPVCQIVNTFSQSVIKLAELLRSPRMLHAVVLLQGFEDSAASSESPREKPANMYA